MQAEDHHAFTNTEDEDLVLLDFKINAEENDLFFLIFSKILLKLLTAEFPFYLLSSGADICPPTLASSFNFGTPFESSVR